MTTYKKSLLFLIGIFALGGLVFVVANSKINFPWSGSRSVSSGPISCDFNGVTYQSDNSRMDDDGCNTCVCTETGWSCTQNACFNDGSIGMGTVSGVLGKVAGEYVADRVCAVSLKTEKKHCVQILKSTPSYSIRVPEGEYWIYAEDDDRDDGYKAYYSEHLLCTEGDCKDHTPIMVTVAQNEIAEAHPKDWSAKSWFDKVTVTPSQRKYESYYHKPGAKFNVRARNMSSIEFYYFFIKKAAQDNDTNPKLVGSAVLNRTDEKGWQYWALVLPPDFSSSRVWPVGKDDGGGTTTGWDLGRTKPDESFEEKMGIVPDETEEESEAKTEQN